MVVIEHNLEVIKTADWVIDMGPEGCHARGAIVAQGTPEEVAQVEASHTGRFLREVMERRPTPAPAAAKPAPRAAKKAAAPKPARAPKRQAAE